MSWMRGIFREVYGLFVDDGAFALTILAWVALTAIAIRAVGTGKSWGGILLAAGLLAILAASALRFAQARGKR